MSTESKWIDWNARDSNTYRRKFRVWNLKAKLETGLVQRAAFDLGFRWHSGQPQDYRDCEAMIFDFNTKQILMTINASDLMSEEAVSCGQYSGAKAETLREWFTTLSAADQARSFGMQIPTNDDDISEVIDYSREKILFYNPGIAINTMLQNKLFRYGFSWCDINAEKEQEIKFQTCFWLGAYTDKSLVYSNVLLFASAEMRINACFVKKNFEHHLSRWLAYHNFTEKKQDDNESFKTEYNATFKEEQQQNMPTETTPYDAMVADIANCVMQRISKQEIDERKVNDIVNSIISKQGRLLITIEDKRKIPPETKDFNEPVHKAMPQVIGVLKSGCWCAVVGPTGSGKTLGGLQYAKMTGISLVGVKQMSNMLAPHDLIGFIDANGKYRKGAWTDSILGHVYDNSGIFPDTLNPTNTPALLIIDEMDNSNANIIMLVKALQTGTIAMPYGLQKINPSLGVLATMNTWGTGATREYVGRMAQDAALLNEFQFIEWDYDVDFEEQLLNNLYHQYKDNTDVAKEWKDSDVTLLHALFKGMRAKAEQQKIRVIISTRNLINVAKIAFNNPKWSLHNILKMTVYKGIKEEEVKRIECPELWTKKKQNHIIISEQKVTPKDCPI